MSSSDAPPPERLEVPPSQAPDGTASRPPADTVPPSHPAPNPAPRAAWVLPTATGVGLILGVGLMAGIQMVQGLAANSAARALITDAVEECDLEGAVGIRVGDDGTTLTFDMKGEDDRSGADIVEIACIFGALDMPANISSHIDQTTSMDGRQTESWDDLTISWSYHPSRGLDGVLTVTTDR